jgi:tricorn protease
VSRLLRRLVVSTAICAFVFGIATVAAADPIKFARYPHSSHGKIAFSYHGDIWVANADGSDPARLTAHIAQDIFPRFSPDGRWIAFTSNRMGNDDLFVVPVDGGIPRQVTFHTGGDTMLYWTPDGERLVFRTSRGAHAFYSPLYTVAAAGDLPVPMAMDQGAAGMLSQDGSRVAFNRYGVRYWRKGYRGNSQADIWLQDVGGGEIRQLTDADTQQFRRHTQDVFPMWGADGMVYFMSERDGLFNIWKISPDGGEPVQVTSHGADGVQYASMSPDGRTITYENEFELWTLLVPGGTPEKVVIDIDFDTKDNLVDYLQVDGEADGFDVSPEGDYLAVDHHGEVFVVPTDTDVGEKKQVTSSPWRQRSQTYSPDGEWLAYISDESGDEEIWLYEIATGVHRKVSEDASLKSRPIWAKDGARLAYVAANHLYMVEAATGDTRELAYNEERGFDLIEFSPDSNWILYSRRDPDLNTEVYLFDINAGTEHNLTQNPFSEPGGALTPDGTTLVFVSNRDNGVYHLFKVHLARLTEDPDDPLVRERKKKEGDEKAGRGSTGEGDEQDSETPPALIVDTDRIDRRAVQLTEGEDGVSQFFLSADGETIYFLSNDERGPALFSIALDGKEREHLASGSFQNLAPTEDTRTLFWMQDGGVWSMPLVGGNLDSHKEKVDFDFTVVVDKRAEWRQIFDESWRIMKYRFYDPNMHGFDWASVRERYESLLLYVGQNQDIYDLTNEMIGELNASHTGVSGPSGIDLPETYATRFLGFEMAPRDGQFAVTHVYRDGPADKEWIDLEVGDLVTSIGGQDITPSENYWRILNHVLNEYVAVGVNSSARGGAEHEIRVRTVPSLRDIKYEEWVERNRAYVEEVSGGQIAYVHIRAMNRPSLARFENEIDRFWNAKGIVVDIRYNGGGNIDQQLLDILERRPYEYWNNRWGSRATGRRPRQAIAGPKVMLINRRSGSDSEVTPLGFRDLELGRIVGTPTAGAVIATGSYRLINGGRIRTPGSLVVAYDPTQPNNYGVNLENYGVAPDVWVENSPQDELDGFDRELKTAVDEALRMLADGTFQYSQR